MNTNLTKHGAALCIGLAALASCTSSGDAPTSSYRNLLADYGYSQQDIDQRIEDVCHDLFESDQKIYFTVGDTLGYISDVKNHDVRTEGMSYGMMIAVQLDNKDMFDRLWRWSRLYMQHHEGDFKGYFAWSCNPDGTRRAQGPASDGELYYVTSLLFASNRWGNKTGINYLADAQYILNNVTGRPSVDPKDFALPPMGPDGKPQKPFKGERPKVVVTNLIDTLTKLITFVPVGPAACFTDPSYHLPAFYEVWAKWADDGRSAFWTECAAASRAYMHKACASPTGLSPDYSTFEGEPFGAWGIIGKAFRFDSWRVPMNMVLDYTWSQGADEAWKRDYANRIQSFFYAQGIEQFGDQYNVDGTQPDELLQAGDAYPARQRHSLGLVASLASASIISPNPHAKEFVTHFWDAKHEPYDDGYYDAYFDGLLQLFAYLHLSGKYRVIEPGEARLREVSERGE